MVRLPLYSFPSHAWILPVVLSAFLEARNSAQSIKLNRPLQPDGDVEAFALGRGHVIYRAEQDFDGRHQLFTVPLDASAPPLQLSPPPPPFGFTYGVGNAWVSPDGARVLFSFFDPIQSLEQLFRVPIDGRSAAVQIADSGVPPVFFASAFVELVFTGDGSRALFRSQILDDEEEPFALFQVPVDGSEAPFELGTGTDSPQAFVVSQDGTRVVFTEGITSSARLRASAIDGAELVQLNTPGLPVDRLHVTADGSRVVFLEGLTPGTRLISSTSDGRERKRLDDAPVAGGGVTGFLVTPGERTVVYRADQRVDGRFELFRASIDGRRPPRRALDGTPRRDLELLTPLSVGQGVQPDFALSADGEHVLYRADARTAGVFELFRVALDGGSAPLVLSAPLVAGGDVTSFESAPDQGHVVYRADQRANDVFELFSVLFDGIPVALDTMPALGDVMEFRVAPDSLFVAYRADRDANDVFELHGVPLDGSAAPRKLNGPLVTGGDVQPDFEPLSGRRAIYRADQDTDGVIELFEGFLGRARPVPMR